MGFDPATAAAVASLAEKAIGETQVGTPASPPSNLLGELSEGLGLPSTSALSALAQANNFGQLGAGIDPAQPLESAITPPASELLGGAGAPPPPPTEEEPVGLLGKIGQGANSFFGNLDQNLQSPSKIIGLGLLNRLDPKLGLAGLLGGGLFGDKKVF